MDNHWQIEQGCPQCGAPVTLHETDRILACPFCRTRLYLAVKDFFRYYIPPVGTLDGELLYIPYWRLRGSLFDVIGIEVGNRFVDTNTVAVSHPGIPYSLGLRPQVLKIRFLSPSTEGRFIAPEVSAEQALRGNLFSSDNTFNRNFLGEAVSLIYAPLLLQGNTLTDAILGRPVLLCSTDERERLLATPLAERGEIHFIPTICPHCGWDMEGERDSLVLLCRNCNSAWTCERDAFTGVEFTVLAPPPETKEGTIHLPFWRMRPRIEGMELATYADLIRLANLPKAITPEFTETPLTFRSPAFKLNPSLYLRWARQMTIMRPTGAEDDRLSAGAFYPVTLPLKEAVEGIAITIAEMCADKRNLSRRLSGLRVALEEYRLEYHPFVPDRDELVHASLGLAINRIALTYGVRM